jgi:CRP/FNR family cyclic AMP-dependent transcriptional regulator
MNASLTTSSVGKAEASRSWEAHGVCTAQRPTASGITTAGGQRAAQAPLAPIDFLRSHPAFRQLPANVLEQVKSNVIRRRVQRGTLIFSKGDHGSGLMAVLDGSVRISLPTINGHEVVLDQVPRGEVFGELALIDGQPRSASATAAENCELMVIDRRNFIQFIHSHPEVAVKLLELLCARLRQSNEQVEGVMYASLPVRLARAIVKLAKTTECDTRPARLMITQRELSQMIGISRESTNKQLRAWEKRGWIRIEHGSLTVLDRRALSRISEE